MIFPRAVKYFIIPIFILIFILRFALPNSLQEAILKSGMDTFIIEWY